MLDKVFPKIHQEGYKFLIIAALITIVLYFLSSFLGLICLLLTIWIYYFFRDPDRVSINQEKFFVSPADGLVTFIGESNSPLEDNSDKKLRIAGADNVIMPDKIGGAHMASLVMKPDVVEFIDYISAQEQIDFNLADYSSSTILVPKIQELPTKYLLKCTFTFLQICRINSQKHYNPRSMEKIFPWLPFTKWCWINLEKTIFIKNLDYFIQLNIEGEISLIIDSVKKITSKLQGDN